MILSSSEMDHLPECVAAFNRGFNLNETLRKLLIPGMPLPQDGSQLIQDNLIKFACYFTFIAPILFSGNMLHPADPVHNLIQNFL